MTFRMLGVLAAIIPAMAIFQPEAPAQTPAAADRVAAFDCAKPVRTAFFEYPPLYKGGIGIDPDIVAELARRTGCQFETSVLPRAEIWTQLREDRLDIATSGIMIEGRKDYARLIPYFSVTSVGVGSNAAGSFASFDDILYRPNIRVGIVRGTSFGPYFDLRVLSLKRNGKIIEFDNMAKLSAALVSGDVHAAVMVSEGYLVNFPSPEERALYPVIPGARDTGVIGGYFLNRTRFNAGTANAWFRVMEEMRIDGTLRRICLKYMPEAMVNGFLGN